MGLRVVLVLVDQQGFSSSFLEEMVKGANLPYYYHMISNSFLHFLTYLQPCPCLRLKILQ